MKNLKEALKSLETEMDNVVDEKRSMSLKLSDKESEVESLRAHCTQLKEINKDLQEADKHGSHGFPRNYYPQLSFDGSQSFSALEEPIGKNYFDVKHEGGKLRDTALAFLLH